VPSEDEVNVVSNNRLEREAGVRRRSVAMSNQNINRPPPQLHDDLHVQQDEPLDGDEDVERPVPAPINGGGDNVAAGAQVVTRYLFWTALLTKKVKL
jgi:hypothetical protein